MFQQLPMQNTLFYGDNLPILREYFPDESVDLIYLDPPFNSNRNYNVLFKDESGTDSQAQITAFVDTWHWNITAEETYQEIITDSPPRVAHMISAFREFIGTNQMMAYLVMMTARLLELHRILKPSGSLYLHCDPTASHYLKIVLDTIFGADQFRSEIIWRRTNAHNKLSRQYGPIHDTILFFSKTNNFKFHLGTTPYNRAYIDSRFKYQDDRGFYQLNYLTGPNVRKGESGSEWRGFNPTTTGRHWAIPASLKNDLPNAGTGMKTLEKLDYLYQKELIVFPKKEGGQPMYKQYIGNGVPYQDIWAYQPNTHGVLYDTENCIDEDVKYLESEDEKLDYDTQKPRGLLERILITSSDKNDVVLDPFCGCGTTIAAAQKLNRRWIGIDITHLAIALQKYRLKDTFDLDHGKDYQVIGEPVDLASAKQLAQDDRYQFQWWALSLVKAKPLGGDVGAKSGKKGKDRGIDGEINFIDDNRGKAKRVLVQVKSGKVKSGDVRDLRGAVERENAAVGVFITLNPATTEMKTEAVAAGHYFSEGWQEKYPKIQILDIEALIDGATVKMPPTNITFKKAEKPKTESYQNGLDL